MTHAHRSTHLTKREERGRTHSHSASALPYDYRSTSRSYRKGERFAENYGDDGATRNPGRYGYRRHHGYSRYVYGERGYGDYDQSGQGYEESAEGYGANQYGEEPYAEGPEGYYSRGGGPMSINSPAALDPWNRYGAYCPSRGE